MEIYVYSRSAIEAVKPHEVPHVIISITSAVEDVARLRTNATCLGILRLSFPDAVEPSEHFSEEQLFSAAQAAQIWAFVLRHRVEAQRVIVHCDAGMSRSPAVAAAISRSLKGDDRDYFGGRYVPNARVYRLMLEAYEGAT